LHRLQGQPTTKQIALYANRLFGIRICHKKGWENMQTQIIRSVGAPNSQTDKEEEAARRGVARTLMVPCLAKSFIRNQTKRQAEERLLD